MIVLLIGSFYSYHKVYILIECNGAVERITACTGLCCPEQRPIFNIGDTRAVSAMTKTDVTRHFSVTLNKALAEMDN